MIQVRPVTEVDVLEFVSWRYEPPYDPYNIESDPAEEVEYFLKPETNCRVLEEGGEVVGFFTVGRDAQVPGGNYEQDAIDIGLGVKPERTGRGEGHRFVEPVLSQVFAESDNPTLRVTIAASNLRAQKVWIRAGFTEDARFTTERELMGSTEFVVLTRPMGS